MAEYANVIVDISHEKLDKTFQYRVPQYLSDVIEPGTPVIVPFGARRIRGYVIELTDEAEYDPQKIKDIVSAAEGGIAIEAQLIALAAWMRRNYGGTMNHALKTVLPVKEKKKNIEQKTVFLALTPDQAAEQLAEYKRRHCTARERLLAALIQTPELAWSMVTHKLNVSASVIQAMAADGVVKLERQREYRNPVARLTRRDSRHVLNEEQQRAVSAVTADYDAGIYRTYLLKGVTGSGKTEVYMELIAHVIAQGRQAILLIPEIALTYQTVMRFYNRFGDRVSIMNSRLSPGERYDQFERAKNGDIDIMIGPRSALFTPFANLGIIIIDEEHETSYKSETLPKYHAVDTALQRAGMAHASVVLGSATPSVDSYYRAEKGEYRLLELKKRVMERPLPRCEIIDLREELRMGNRSIFSGRLAELIEDRLKRGSQIMLFINRRGMSGFVSCRACGHVIKCPHCDVSLSQHRNTRTGETTMLCHYCGYEQPVPQICPSCGSKYISGFKAGTQKIEMMVKERFPEARVLRMDMDTTRSKEGYGQILSAFANREADILIGTQMIVKGHDFPGVTLVGVLAADMSLHVGDYHAAERTFELLTQAAGRAGRGSEPGHVVIQTYTPDHYSIVTAKEQDYEAFYRQEIAYRSMLCYPPVWNLLLILCTSKEEETAGRAAASIASYVRAWTADMGGTCPSKTAVIGPSDASIAKISDVYRKVVYVKAPRYETLVALKDRLEQDMKDRRLYQDAAVQFDFNPTGGF